MFLVTANVITKLTKLKMKTTKTTPYLDPTWCVEQQTELDVFQNFAWAFMGIGVFSFEVKSWIWSGHLWWVFCQKEIFQTTFTTPLPPEANVEIIHRISYLKDIDYNSGDKRLCWRLFTIDKQTTENRDRQLRNQASGELLRTTTERRRKSSQLLINGAF